MDIRYFEEAWLYANLKNYQFYKEKVYFLSYVVSAQKVKIEGKKIEIIKNWPELMSIHDIQMFIGFANFY